MVDAAQAEVYAVTEKRSSEDYSPLGDIIEATIEEIEASEGRGEAMVGVPTGFADLDQLTNGLHPGQMIVLRGAAGDRQVDDGVGCLRAAASIQHGLTSVIFSLEMSRTEITMRLLSAEAKVPLQNMRKGTMREEDWTRLARTMGEVNNGAVVHRRFAEHVADGDPGEVPAAEAAARPEAGGDRLPAADDLGQAGRSPASRRSASSPGR